MIKLHIYINTYNMYIGIYSIWTITHTMNQTISFIILLINAFNSFTHSKILSYVYLNMQLVSCTPVIKFWYYTVCLYPTWLNKYRFKSSLTTIFIFKLFFQFAIQISAGMMNGDAPSVDSVQPVSYYVMRCYMCIL